MREPPSISDHSPYDVRISPELVLVSSPEDARWAREQLPEPGPGHVQRRQASDAADEVHVERGFDPMELHDATSLFAAADAAVAGRGPRRRRVRPLRLGRAGSAAVAIAAVLVVALPVAGLTPKVRPVLVESETSAPVAGPAATAGSPPTGSAGPASTAGAAGAVDAASAGAGQRSPPATAKATARRRASPSSVPAASNKRAVKESPQVSRPRLLSWTSYPGARGYWVRVVVLGPAGDERTVLTRKTEVPRLRLPTTVPDGPRRPKSLPPGSYRWYIWPDTGAYQSYDAPTTWGSFSVP